MNQEPAQVALRFSRRIDSLLRDYKSLVHNAQNNVRKASMETLLAEQTVMSLGIYWEAFLHDLLVALVGTSPDQCIADYQRRMLTSLSDKYSGGISWVSITPPSSLTKAQIELLLDPQGRNVTVQDADKLAKFANRFFPARIARRFTLDPDDSSFLAFLVALRNFLAHRSDASRAALRLAVDGLQPTGLNVDLKEPIARFDRYIKRCPNGVNRVEIICSRLKSLAGTLGGI